jgi:hypothetical protein
MPDLKANYDRVVLIALGLIAAVMAFVLAGSAGELKEQALVPLQNVKQEPFVNERDVELLKEDLAAMAESKPWNTSDASPFVSRVYLLKDDRLVDILESGNELFPGISNAWILEHELDYLDPALPEQDPDSDGFTNFEEFTAKTNPRDTASKPAQWTKLRVADVKIEQLQLIFAGRDVKGRASINSVAAASERLTGKAFGPTVAYEPGSGEQSVLKVKKFKPGPGNTLLAYEFDEETTPFRLVGFRTEKRENPSIMGLDGKPTVDEVVFAILESTSGDKTKVELEAGKPQTSPYSLASLVDTRPGGATIQIRTGESFDLGEAPRYKLVDVSVESATIEDLGTGEQHVIPKAAAPPELQPPSEEAQIQ